MGHSLDKLGSRPLARMNGIGNAIVVLDLRGTDAVLSSADARAIAAAPGLRYDQLMAIHDPAEPGTDAFVRIYNTDGSPSGACGNGTRCVAWFLLRDDPRDDLLLTTATARLACRRLAPTMFSVDMGAPTFEPALIPLRAGVNPAAVDLDIDDPAVNALGTPTALGIGNPHCVFFVPDAAAVDLARVGPPVENAAVFPERANVSFAQIVDPATILLRVWERGAGATLGCGTGACATLVAAAVTGRTGRTADVDLPGGRLRIDWREDDDHVVMTGPVELERDTTLAAALPELAA